MGHWIVKIDDETKEWIEKALQIMLKHHPDYAHFKRIPKTLVIKRALIYYVEH